MIDLILPLRLFMYKKKNHILIVDDDKKILNLLSSFFIQNSFIVSIADNVDNAQKVLSYFTFDLIILDVMLPGITGLEFAKTIKSKDSSIPVVLLTALSELEDKLRGFDAKVDDYITKPFDPEEILARCRNLINLYDKNLDASQKIFFGEKYYDLKRRILIHNGCNIFLSSVQKDLLEILIKNLGSVVQRETIAQILDFTEGRSVDVQISRLRSKIEYDSKNPQYLHTIRQKGYILHI